MKKYPADADYADYTRKGRKACQMIDRFFMRCNYNLRNARLYRRYRAHMRAMGKLHRKNQLLTDNRSL